MLGIFPQEALAFSRSPSRLGEAFLRLIISEDELYLARNSAFLLNITLIEAGLALCTLSPLAIYQALARATGAHFSLTPPPDYALSLTKSDWQPALKTLVLHLHKGKKTAFWHAPQGKLIGEFIQMCEAKPSSAKKFYLTTPQCFLTYFQEKTKSDSAKLAVTALKHEKPHYSASSLPQMKRFSLSVFGLSLMLASVLFLNDGGAFYLGLAFNGLVFLWLFVRVCGALFTPPPHTTTHFDEFPIYSIIIALYNESQMIESLIKALHNLDYPKDKLDLIFMLEEDDEATREALLLVQHHLSFSIIISPNIQPRTKPKALMVALPYVRGEFVCVYDAEDIPHPLQLQEALSVFEHSNLSLAVVQAPLTIRNEGKNALTALFSLDYASLFSSTLPFLARFNLPLPLGGTSNHFRTESLRAAGGWDPYNVTEDADLGLRLARLGFSAATLVSETSEEAPERFSVWLKQRTRWYKGWLQTIAVHYSHPFKLYQDLGAVKLSFYSVMIVATFLSSLFHPFVLGLIGYGVLFDKTVLSIYCMTLLFAGYGICIIIYAREIWRKKSYILAAYLVFLPLYWVLLSIAAWRALIELYTKPYHWDKTPHGIIQNDTPNAR